MRPIHSTLLILVTLFANPLLAVAQERYAALHETPNWRFITPEFEERVAKRRDSMQGERINVVGTVRDEQGELIQNAFVTLRIISNTSTGLKKDVHGNIQDVFATTWTDGKGVFSFTKQPSPWSEVATPTRWELAVFAPGKAMFVKRYLYLDSKNRIEKIQLQEGIVIQGRVLDAAGDPVANFPLVLGGICDPTSSEIYEHMPFFGETAVWLRTNEKGKIRLGGFWPKTIVNVSFPQNAHVVGLRKPSAYIRTSLLDQDTKIRGPLKDYFADATLRKFSIQLPEAELPAKIEPLARRAPAKLRTINVRVVDSETGVGVPGVCVNSVRSSRIPPSFATGMIATNAGGYAVLEVIEGAKQYVYVGGRKYGYETTYRRITTSPKEFSIDLPDDEWIKEVPAGEDDASIEFQVRPVPTLKVTVLDKAGQPLANAKLEAWLYYSRNYRLPPTYTDEDGKAEMPIRPVVFKVDLRATDADGNYVELDDLELKKDLDSTDEIVLSFADKEKN